MLNPEPTPVRVRVINPASVLANPVVFVLRTWPEIPTGVVGSVIALTQLVH